MLKYILTFNFVNFFISKIINIFHINYIYNYNKYYKIINKI